ncbi:2'-5' RNA ligase family protein [Solicola gregarius]|uniref:2'-5' RNA ligase family protein n=1 Tax=Solicola gregarius TaxID=2908642 RepID=A0AA46TI23_9ACTN|nr:2'-5' RNA ligase family protein [Solicola gregarius]UYM05505.1 2'-5' RNA ligase family protein [Solicola gregarius]UYM05538.1 2'-5' RNA ligase family protein [Solicola gregarius]
MSGGQSALIVEVPEAEAAVGSHRAALDDSAALGVPAHLTVLVPFVDPARIDSATLDDLGELFARFSSFDFTLTRTDWFGNDVLWLGSEDSTPFRVLTEHVHSAYPDHPPYDGAFDDVVPHLTIAHDVEPERMRAAERAVAESLPIRAAARSVTLIAQTTRGGRWSELGRFRLA